MAYFTLIQQFTNIKPFHACRTLQVQEIAVTESSNRIAKTEISKIVCLNKHSNGCRMSAVLQYEADQISNSTRQIWTRDRNKNAQ